MDWKNSWRIIERLNNNNGLISAAPAFFVDSCSQDKLFSLPSLGPLSFCCILLAAGPVDLLSCRPFLSTLHPPSSLPIVRDRFFSHSLFLSSQYKNISRMCSFIQQHQKRKLF